MNTRTFLGNLCALPFLGFLKPNEEFKLTNVNLQDLPQPIDRLLRCHYGLFDLTISVTNNILLECKDDEGKTFWETNVYKKYYKVIAQASLIKSNINESKSVRFESEVFTIDQLDQIWKKSISNILNKLRTLSEMEMTEIHLIPIKYKV